jgi:chromatin remodeling complex protein RSC6
MATKSATSKLAVKPSAKAAVPEKKSAAGSAFMKPMKPDTILAAIIGTENLPRTEVMKKFWEYVKARDLQDPKNKRVILADAALKPLFGRESATMFEVPGLLGKHLTAVDK